MLLLSTFFLIMVFFYLKIHNICAKNSFYIVHENKGLKSHGKVTSLFDSVKKYY